MDRGGGGVRRREHPVVHPQGETYIAPLLSLFRLPVWSHHTDISSSLAMPSDSAATHLSYLKRHKSSRLNWFCWLPFFPSTRMCGWNRQPVTTERNCGLMSCCGVPNETNLFIIFPVLQIQKHPEVTHREQLVRRLLIRASFPQAELILSTVTFALHCTDQPSHCLSCPLQPNFTETKTAKDMVKNQKLTLSHSNSFYSERKK